jgi:hypothetical protein
MEWIPGWNSIVGANTWANFWFWASIASLVLLGVSEVVSHRYTERKDELAATQQTDIERKYNEEIARLHLETAQAQREAAGLRLELDREIQKRAQRILREDQKAAMLAELRGKIPTIAIVTQNDLEAQAFSIQFVSLFQDAGAKPIYAPEPPREDKWFAPAGLVMYSPLGQSEEQLKEDPLYRALKAANLFGGTTSRPFLSLQLRGPTPAEIPGYNGHVLYIGQKSPY